MKKLRILSVTDRPVLGSYETGFGNRKEYEKVYLDNLEETFGSEIITTAAHRIAFYGDFTEEIKDLAALIGFGIVGGG